MSIMLAKGLINHLNPVLILTLRFSISTIFLAALLLRSNQGHRFKINLTRIFHTDRDEEVAKPDETRQAKILTQGCVSTHCSSQNQSLTQYSSGFPASAVDRYEISGLMPIDWLVLIAKGTGAGIFFNFIMLAGLYFSTANSAGLITSLLPAMIICLNVLFFKQRLIRNMILSIVIAVAGLAFINANIVSSNSKNALLGNTLILLSLIPEGLYYTLSKYRPLQIHPLLHTLLMSASNLPILYMLALFVPASAWKQITAHDALMIFIIGLTAGLFFIYWEKGVKGVTAAYAALSTALMPLTTVLLAWIILGEALSFHKLIGMILVIFSIVSYAKTQSTS